MAFTHTLTEALVKTADFLGVAFFDLSQAYQETVSDFEAARKSLLATKGKDKRIFLFYSPSVNPHLDNQMLNSFAMPDGKKVKLTFFDEHPVNNNGKACQVDGAGRKFGALIYIDISARVKKGSDDDNLQTMTRICIRKFYSADLQFEHNPDVRQTRVSR